MALDNEPVTMAYALKVAKKYYPKDKYEHAIRVMQYVADNEMIPKQYREDCLVLAVMHDLLEDTEYLGNALPENTNKALNLLTKSKDKDYIEYIKEIRETSHINWRMCAYWVKLADMKDHLAQTETLTEKLRDKYLAALPYLL
jgi:HD superfamily phosphohydrolase YqeK